MVSGQWNFETNPGVAGRIFCYSNVKIAYQFLFARNVNWEWEYTDLSCKLSVVIIFISHFFYNEPQILFHFSFEEEETEVYKRNNGR